MSEQNEQSVGGDVDRGEAPPRFAEQITADPKPDTKKREKDPKKVAAGKKLAEYNKKAKEALAREMKREQKIKQEEEQDPTSRGSNENTYSEAKSWLPELSFTTVLSVIGLGFTAFDLFMRYKEKARDEYSNRIADLSQVPQLPQPKKIPFSVAPKSLGME